METLFERIKELAKDTPQTEPLYWVETRPMCAECRNYEVTMPGDLCEICTQERKQGFQSLSLTGRCANGAQRDAGRLFHAVRRDSYSAMCGSKPGRRSRWSEYHGTKITCPRCLKKLGKARGQ